MKPTKNRVFCLGCKRTKMLFREKAKAINFLRFNQEEIEKENGYAPCRAYYCKICGGWHLTSQSVLFQSTKPRVIQRRKALPMKENIEEKPMLTDKQINILLKKLARYEELVLRGENLEMVSQNCNNVFMKFTDYKCPVRLKPQMEELRKRFAAVKDWIRIIPILDKADIAIKDCISYVDSQMIQAAMERHDKARELLYQATQIEGLDNRKRQHEMRLDAIESRMNAIWKRINIKY